VVVEVDQDHIVDLEPVLMEVLVVVELHTVLHLQLVDLVILLQQVPLKEIQVEQVKPLLRQLQTLVLVVVVEQLLLVVLEVTLHLVLVELVHQMIF